MVLNELSLLPLRWLKIWCSDIWIFGGNFENKGFLWGDGVIPKKPYTDWVKISSNLISFGILKTVPDPSSGSSELSSAF